MIGFDMDEVRALQAVYTSGSQLVRVLTERWFAANGYCPRCGCRLRSAKTNARVLDFVCSRCPETFELKSMKGGLKRTVPGGSHDAMMERLRSTQPPGFMFLAYTDAMDGVRDILYVPGRFLDPSVIDRRQPLSIDARRAGWVGCMIRLGHVPELGKIPIVENGEWIDRTIVQRAFAATSVLEHQAEPASRSWILDVLRCVERLPQDEFVLADIYMSEAELQSLHPDNRNVRAKIRQQLQVLRDHGVIAFTSRGSYRRVASGRTPDAAHHAREQERSKGLPRKRHSAPRLPRGEA